MVPSPSLVVERHAELDRAMALGRHRRFLSGYNSRHPYERQYLPSEIFRLGSDETLGAYRFAQDEGALTDSIRDFHRRVDGVEYGRDEVLVSAGSSPLLLAVLATLRDRSSAPLRYLPPIYHAFLFHSRLLRMQLEPVSSEPLFRDDSILKLPDEKTSLILSDPIWFAGRRVGAGAMAALRDWQDRTGSAVIVDGTFQYLSWDATDLSERSARLNRELTLRLVCPTKSLAVHGVRFAYLLGPAAWLAELRWTCDNVIGSASYFDLRAAHHLMAVLNAPQRNTALVEHIRTRYESLLSSKFLQSVVADPNAGYYVFGRIREAEPTDLLMDATYFGVGGLEGNVRINLLSPDLSI